MSESQPVTFSAENTPQGFSIEGDGNRFFLDEGEGLTDGEKGKEFGGFINLIGADGKTERFSGGIYDQGDHWQVLKFDGDGGEYLIPKAGGAPEVKQKSSESGETQPVEVPVGGLEDAAALTAMEAAPGEAAALEPQPGQAEFAPAEAPAELPLPVEPEPVVVEEPAAEAVQPPAPEPVLAPEPETISESAVVELLTSAEPMAGPVVEPAGAPEKASKENRHPLIVDLQQKMQGVSRPFQAARLWKQAEAVRAEVSKTRSEKKVGELLAEEGKLKRQAEELNPGIEKMTEAERKKLSLESVPLSEEGVAEAVKISSPRHREDMAVFYDAELQKWENVLSNPADFEQYRAAAAEIETKKNEARKLFSAERDSKLLNKAIAQIDQTGSGQLKELEAKLPQRLLELAGFIHSEAPTLNQAESDVDLRLAYNRAAQDLYAELAGQPQTVAETVTAPMPEPEPAPGPILPQEPVVTEPVAEITAEPIVEGSAEPVTEATSQQEVESVPAVMEENLTEVTVPAVEEAAPSEPIAAPAAAAEATEQGQGQVVDDAVEQARVAGMPVETPVEAAAAEESNSDMEALDWLSSLNSPAGSSVSAPMPEGSAAPAGQAAVIEGAVAGAPVMAPAEASAQPEAAAETPEQRSERRKQGFAGALAELDVARNNTSGTEGEQKVRLAEAYNQAIGAAMELMEEGEAAKEVVKGFLAGALGTPGGRKLTEVAVRSRMDETGVTGAPAGEKKKKLEQAGLLGLIELLLELGMNFSDKTIGAVVTEVQSATGGGK